MRKTIFFVCFLVLLLYSVQVWGAEISLEQAILQANQELGLQYYISPSSVLINNIPLEMELNREIWDEREYLVYGSPADVPINEQDYEQGHYRYLGYTKTGDLFPNPDFPPDHGATSLINSWSWYNEPWTIKSPFHCNGLYLMWDDLPENEPYLIESLKAKFENNTTLFDPKTRPRKKGGGTAEGWFKVTKILQPRTSVTPGLGRLWHNWNNTPWYITIVIPAKLPEVSDLEAVSIKRTSPVLLNTHQVAQAVFKNNGKAADFTAEYYLNGNKVGSEQLHIEEGETRTRSFSWTSPAKAGTYSLKIYAVSLEGEKNIENNSKTTSVVVQAPNHSKPDCEFTSKLNGSWEETYSWQVYHPETCTDKNGKQSDCSWIENVSETVGYTESLTAALTVNSKQGIPTDRDNPRESDRESRGSWEIIPYAQANGLDPNEITRAGYGFEVKVKTTYRTDWETKVPGPASPHGGIYRGPYKVTAQFYDTSMRQVDEIELEATNGQPGDTDITWEIPLSRFEFSDGTYAWVRKHYTDVHNKDGYYGVRVIIEDCGRGQLSVCRDKYVTIYGDMYDDIYTRPATAEEW